MKKRVSHRLRVTERGWVGHFICANRCRYRRNTLVSDGAQHVVISSVGCMENWDKASPEKIDTIGHERYYETMVFRGHKEGPYIESDVSNQISIPGDYEWGIFGKKMADLPDDVDMKMDAIHEKIIGWVCRNFNKCFVPRPSL